MSMIGPAPNFLRWIFGERAIAVDQESNAMLALRYGKLQTVFDRNVGHVFQDGKLVGTFDVIDRIELHKPAGQEGAANWFVTIKLSGERTIEVGQVTDATDASVICARIAKVTGRPVIAKS